MGNRFYISVSHGIGKVAHCDHANASWYGLINLSSCRHPGDETTDGGVLQGWHFHDVVIKWKHVPQYWHFVRGIHRSPVDSPHKGQWRWVLLFSLICAWTIDWANNRDSGDLKHHGFHYDVTVMMSTYLFVADFEVYIINWCLWI